MTQHQNNSLSGQWLQRLTCLPVLVVALVLVTATSATMADSRFDNRGPRFNNSWNASFNRNNRHTVNPRFDRNSSWNSSWNSLWNRSGTRFSNRAWNNRFSDNRHRYRNNRDNWSVSVNVGTGYFSSYNAWNRPFYNRSVYNTGLYSGVGSLTYGTSVWSNRYAPRRNNTTVIYTQPNVVYVNDSSQASGHGYSNVTSSRSTRGGQRSLLRDIHGDCYERTYNSQGRETRIQLPGSACNF